MTDVHPPTEGWLLCGPMYLAAGFRLEIIDEQRAIGALEMDVDPGAACFGLNRVNATKLHHELTLLLQQWPEGTKPL